MLGDRFGQRGHVPATGLLQSCGTTERIGVIVVSRQLSEQPFDRIPCIGLRIFGQMQIDERRLQRGMPHVFLDHLQPNAGFEQVRRIGMAQRVDREFFAEVELLGDQLHRTLDSGFRHRAFGLALAMDVEAVPGRNSWKYPSVVMMGEPVGTQQLQGRFWQGDVAILFALTAMDVSKAALALEVGRL